MPYGNSKGYDGATKGEKSFNPPANRPTHVPKPTDSGNVSKAKAQTTSGKANNNSGVGRLQSYNKGRRGR